MIKINNYSLKQAQRYIVDFVEPFVSKQIQKKHHTFFVYRCSDYNDLNHLKKVHMFELKNMPHFVPILEKYWSAIDLIRFTIEEQPTYACTKEYFDALEDLQIKNKVVSGIYLYEVKLVSKNRKPTLSIKTNQCINDLRKIGFDMKVVFVRVTGNAHLMVSLENIRKKDYVVKTHYGRKGYYCTEKHKFN